MTGIGTITVMVVMPSVHTNKLLHFSRIPQLVIVSSWNWVFYFPTISIYLLYMYILAHSCCQRWTL